MAWDRSMIDEQFISSVQTACNVLDDERQRAAAERQAFARFQSEIAARDVNRPQPDGGTLTPTYDMHVTDTPPKQVSEAIQDTYRATVMSVPHYTEEYDEPLETHLTAEFGADVAAAISTATRMTPRLKKALLVASQTARDARGRLIASIDAERDALTETDELLTEIESTLHAMNSQPLETWSFEQLVDWRQRLLTYEQRCDDRVADRQAVVHARMAAPRTAEVPCLTAYLYQELEVTYPILAAIVTRIDHLQQARRRVERALATSV